MRDNKNTMWKRTFGEPPNSTMFQTWSSQLPQCSCVPRSPPQRGKLLTLKKLKTNSWGGCCDRPPFQMAELLGAFKKKWWEPFWLRTGSPWENSQWETTSEGKDPLPTSHFVTGFFLNFARGENMDKSWQRQTVELGVLFMLQVTRMFSKPSFLIFGGSLLEMFGGIWV